MAKKKGEGKYLVGFFLKKKSLKGFLKFWLIN